MKKRFQLLGIVMVTLIVGYALKQWSDVILYVTGIVIELVGMVITVRLLLWDKRSTNSKVAWIAVIFILPIIGVLCYLFFGRNPQRRPFHVNQTSEIAKLSDAVQALPRGDFGKTAPELALRMEHLTGFRAAYGNDVQLLTNGEETFPAMLEALKQARHHIHMQFYIYREDEIGTEIRDILIARSRAGVEVRFMYDDLGSKHLTESFLAPLREAGIDVHAFDPFRSILVARTANFRNHRKTVVVDGQIGFTGGLNVGEEYRSNTDEFTIWRDTHLRLEGTGVRGLQEAFLTDWVYMENEAGAADPFISEAGIQRYFNPTRAGDDWAQVVYGGPYDKEHCVRDAMLNLIDSAKSSVWITSPYFVPDEESLAVLRRVAMSGIDVKLLLPGKGDAFTSFHGSNAYVDTMLAAGAEVYAYRDDSFIHSKVVLIDEERAAVGTANFDFRSFRLNHELMVFLYEQNEAVTQLKRDFENDLAASRKYTIDDMKNKPVRQRLKENLSSLLSPML